MRPWACSWWNICGHFLSYYRNLFHRIQIIKCFYIVIWYDIVRALFHEIKLDKIMMGNPCLAWQKLFLIAFFSSYENWTFPLIKNSPKRSSVFFNKNKPLQNCLVELPASTILKIQAWIRVICSKGLLQFGFVFFFNFLVSWRKFHVFEFYQKSEYFDLIIFSMYCFEICKKKNSAQLSFTLMVTVHGEKSPKLAKRRASEISLLLQWTMYRRSGSRWGCSIGSASWETVSYRMKRLVTKVQFFSLFELFAKDFHKRAFSRWIVWKRRTNSKLLISNYKSFPKIVAERNFRNFQKIPSQNWCFRRIFNENTIFRSCSALTVSENPLRCAIYLLETMRWRCGQCERSWRVSRCIVSLMSDIFAGYQNGSCKSAKRSLVGGPEKTMTRCGRGTFPSSEGTESFSFGNLIRNFSLDGSAHPLMNPELRRAFSCL